VADQLWLTKRIWEEEDNRDCNPGSLFSIPGSEIEESVIPWSCRDYRLAEIYQCMLKSEITGLENSAEIPGFGIAIPSWQHWPRENGLLCWQQLWTNAKVEREAVFIFSDIFLSENRISRGRGKCLGEDVNAVVTGNRISDANILTASDSNCGSILFSFQDMTMDRQWTDDGHMDWHHQPSHIWHSL